MQIYFSQLMCILRNVKRSKSIIGILMIVVSIASLLAWEKWGRNRLFYEDIIVMKNNVAKGTVITEEMIDTVRMEIKGKDRLGPSDKKLIVGSEAAFFIHSDVPLFCEYFADEGMVADKGGDRYIISIPADCIISIPFSIAKNDEVYLYSGGKFVTQSAVYDIDSERLSYEIIADGKQAKQISEICDRGDKFVIAYN